MKKKHTRRSGNSGQLLGLLLVVALLVSVIAPMTVLAVENPTGVELSPVEIIPGDGTAPADDLPELPADDAADTFVDDPANTPADDPAQLNELEPFETVEESVSLSGASITIANNIVETGTLDASLSLDDDTGVTYTWYKNGIAVERTKVTGTSYNISEDGKSLNVALDGGAQCTYYVVATASDGSSVQSAPITVSYYDTLQNGSFENPDIENGRNIAHQQYPEGTAGLIWKTTGSDNLIEIFSVSEIKGYTAREWVWDGWNSGYRDVFHSYKEISSKVHNCDTAADGDQVAEINAEAAGALYQDVLTVPGSTMYW